MEDKVEKKLRGLSKRLVDLIPEVDSPQGVYNHLVPLMERQKDYFQMQSPSFILKLVFYIYSLRKTNDYSLAPKMLDKVFLANFIVTENEFFEESCNQCGGNGTIPCEYCDGTGEVECNNCNGTGKELCPDCDGAGEIYSSEEEGGSVCNTCQGGGEVECYACNGDTNVSCQSCGGKGEQNCYNCDGSGEVQTEYLVYQIYTICSWNKNLKDRCELREDTTTPVISEDAFNGLRKNFILLNSSEQESEFNFPLTNNMLYCFEFESSVSETSLLFTKRMGLSTGFQPTSFYTKS